MKTSRLALLACFLMSFALPGCSDSSSGPKSVSSTDSKPKVALIMKSLANEFFSTMAAGAEKHNKENSGSYELVVNGIKDERDLSRQVALVDEMIAMNVNAIVIAPADSKALVPALRKAIEKGIVVVNIDNKLDVDILKQENVQIPFVGPDNRAGAKAVAERLAAELKSGDEVLILEGIRTSFNAQQRLEGFKDACNAAGLKVVDSQSAEWEMSRANTIASAMLSEHPQVKAILAANDNMALGALASAKSAGRNDIKIVGFDNINAVKQAIQEGKILATADQHGDKLAVFGIEVALDLIKGGASANKESTFETPVDIITADRL